MKEAIVQHGIISIVLILIGIGLYIALNYLLNLPGNRKIDRIFQTEEEKREDRRWKRKIFRTYIIILIWAVIATNLLLYYIV